MSKNHRQILEALSGLLLVLFVAMISSTIVSIALPQIITALKGTQSQYTWVITASLLAATASTPIWGRLADLYNKKTLLQISLVLFLIGSIACGFAQNTPQLIAFRVVQGLGMGALQVLVQVVMAAMIPPKERGKYNGYLGGVMAVATVGGPLLGGLIADTDWLGWRWCFFISVPFCVAAWALLHKTLKIETVRREGVVIDYAGATLIAAGVSLLLIWITFVDNSFAWVSWQTGAMVGGTVVLLGLATWVESRAKQPVVPLHIIKQRTPALAILASLAVGMAMFGGAVFLGQYFQVGRGFSPTQAGLMTIPMMAGVLLSSAISGQIISRTGKVRPFIIAGALVLTVGFLGLSLIQHDTSIWLIIPSMVLVGAGVGMAMQNLVLALQNTVALHDLGAASGAITFFRSLGGTIGVSILGAVLANQVAAGVVEGHPLPVAFADATGHIFLVSAGIAALGVIATLFLRPAPLRETVEKEETPVPAGASA
ncbi:MDR family MFS transporter [Herbidospora mongoliensis]|uniref:MDR family MFS transporter n=1 Tax=Herbidospora mongoliensis TaxID=688067 RepID=UPI00082E7856|nr:MDR family MFS transporter [Herbidospora mongoliensis]